MFCQFSNSCGVILFQVFAVMSMVSLVCSLPAQGSDSLEPPPRHKPYFDTPVKRPQRGVRDNDPVRCKEFIETNPKDPQIFTSPNYPHLYPNNTDCVRILDAGENHIIKLEFREIFEMEEDGRGESECSFDFLEVRDGGYGYSNLLGKYCGNKWPDQLTSSGRRMYLHFHTDDTIEKEGFSLFYTALPRPTDGETLIGPELAPCLVSVGGAEGYVNRTDIDHNCPERVNQSIFFHRPLECMWLINVSLNWKIQLNFLNFKLEMPNDCDNNFVQIFRENTDVPSILNHFCGAKAEMTVSNNNIMHVRFYASPAAINSTFEALFTAYREGNKKPCHADEFDCQDDTCISRTLRCNKRYNCRFRWDEDEDECKKVISPMQEILGSEHIIIILVIFCLILSGMCFAFVFNCVRKLVRDHRIIQEHIRSSREMLEQAGKSTPKESAGHTISRRGSVVGVRGDSVGVASPTGPRSRSAPEDCYVPSSGGMIPLLLRSTPGADSVTPAPPINGDAVFIRDEHLADRSSSSPRDFDDDADEDDGNDMDGVEMVAFTGSEPEMRDNECQTRESLFLISSSEHSSSPPLPPPPEPRVRGKGGGGSSHHSGSEARMPPPPPPGWAATPNFTTFGHTRRHPADTLRDRSAAPKDYASLPHHHHHHHHQPPPVPAPPPADAIQRFRAEAVIEVDNSRRPFSVESTKSAPDVIVTH